MTKNSWKDKEFLKNISNKTVFIITVIVAVILLFFLMKNGGGTPGEWVH